MPEGTAAQDFTYRRATRGQFALLIMIAGGAGTGKTYSALRLARGMAGPHGKIFVADTDNGRAKLYADEFQFEHLDLREPYRPKLFEDAATAAQKQGAAVLIIDNFMHEHAGPGGLLEYHEEELHRLTKGDLSKRDSLNMVAWIRPKMEHKHMRERLYQLNVPVILCCGAERKIAMVLQKEGPQKGKTIPVDQGFVPICGADIPYAMTLSLMLLDVAKPGVPTPIKALLPSLKPIISLDKPLDEEVGAKIAAWMSGRSVTKGNSPERELPKPVPAPSAPADDFPGDRPAAGDQPSVGTSEKAQAGVREREVMDNIINRFRAVGSLKEHQNTVNNKEMRERFEWFRKKRPKLWRIIEGAILDSYIRNGGQQITSATSKEGALI